jgi:hypothetical protein
VGTPESIADVFESFINEADVDGFNVACMLTLSSSLSLLLSLQHTNNLRCLESRVLRRSSGAPDPGAYGARHHVERLHGPRRYFP